MSVSAFEVLSKIDVSEHTEKKGRFTYLSWAWAVRTLLEHFPEAIWEVHEYDRHLGESGGYVSQPYMQTPAGAFVKVTLTIKGIDRTQVHPVLDNVNKTVEKPNAFQVNTSIQRCLAKAIALHGLGLYIYAGEDLPTAPDKLNKDQYESILSLLHVIGDKALETKVVTQIGEEVINDSNYKACYDSLKAKSNRVKKQIDKLDKKRAKKWN